MSALYCSRERHSIVSNGSVRCQHRTSCRFPSSRLCDWHPRNVGAKRFSGFTNRKVLGETALRTPRRKELLNQLRARLRFNATSDVDAMIQTRMPHQISHRPAHPRLLIIRPKHQLPDLRQHDRAGALRTRLERDVERAVGKTIRLERVERALDRQKLGMIRGIAPSHGLVMRLGDDVIAPHHDRTDRDFVLGRSEPRLCQRGPHPASRISHPVYVRTASRARSKVKEFPSFALSTRTRSPSAYCPSNTPTASGFWSNRWIARFSGRAPYTGS